MILFQADRINHFSSKILLLLKMKVTQTSSDGNSGKKGGGKGGKGDLGHGPAGFCLRDLVGDSHGGVGGDTAGGSVACVRVY